MLFSEGVNEYWTNCFVDLKERLLQEWEEECSGGTLYESQLCHEVINLLLRFRKVFSLHVGKVKGFLQG